MKIDSIGEIDTKNDHIYNLSQVAPSFSLLPRQSLHSCPVVQPYKLPYCNLAVFLRLFQSNLLMIVSIDTQNKQ